MDCGQRYPSYVMQFDHVRGVKLFDVGAFAATNRPLTHLHREIAKCEVVCANCHAERTHRRRIDKLAAEAASVDSRRSEPGEAGAQPTLFLDSCRLTVGYPPRRDLYISHGSLHRSA